MFKLRYVYFRIHFHCHKKNTMNKNGFLQKLIFMQILCNCQIIRALLTLANRARRTPLEVFRSYAHGP